MTKNNCTDVNGDTIIVGDRIFVPVGFGLERAEVIELSGTKIKFRWSDGDGTYEDSLMPSSVVLDKGYKIRHRLLMSQIIEDIYDGVICADSSSTCNFIQDLVSLLKDEDVDTFSNNYEYRTIND